MCSDMCKRLLVGEAQCCRLVATTKPSTETSIIVKLNYYVIVVLADGQHIEVLKSIYNICLSDSLDKQAPWRNGRMKNNSPHPWYDADVDETRRKRRS